MVNIQSLNLNGLGLYDKRKEQFYVLKLKGCDVAMIQETHCTQDKESLWKNEWGGSMYFSNGTSAARGVMTMFKVGLEHKINQMFTDDRGRALVLDVTIEETEYTLVNVYAPNYDDPDFFIDVFSMITKSGNTNIIMAGDFNLVLDVKCDRSGTNLHNHLKSCNVLKQLMEQCDLCDLRRELNPERNVYTWHDTNRSRSRQSSRIDFFLVSNDLRGRVEECTILPGFRSDHSPILLRIRNSNLKRGRGFWKFNALHLNNKEFTDKLKTVISSAIRDNSAMNPDLKWEALKLAIQGWCVEFSISHSKKKNAKIQELEAKLQTLRTSLNENNADEVLLNEFHKASTEMENFIQEKVQARIFMSKVKWHQEGERSSKYFFALEKKNYNKKSITSLRLGNGTVVSDQAVIRIHQEKFYKNLYAVNQELNFNIENIQGEKISDQDKVSLDQELGIDKLTTALMQMQNGKTPGSDGLNAELYKFVWEDIKHVFLQAVSYAFTVGKLHSSSRRGIIILTPKKDRDLLELTNWRPLTMLNVDYKIIAKALANRMKKVLPSIISSEQTGFMQNRNIKTNIRRAIEVMEYTKKNNIAALYLNLDYEKCFDNVNIRVVDKVFKLFNFGDNFIKWIQILHTNFQLTVVNNGFCTEWIDKESGLHQGCPQAPLTYLIYGQLLNLLLKNNPLVKGVPVMDTTQLLSQFADDTDLFLIYDQQSFQATMDTLDVIYTSLGLKINYNKTCVYRIGSLANTNATLYTQKPIAWTNDPVKVLGIDIANDMQEVAQTNYELTISKVESVLRPWVHRGLTLSGKVMVINSLVASLFVYKMAALPSLPGEVIARYDKIIHNFLWNGKRAKISTDILVKPREHGGLRLVNLQCRDNASMDTHNQRKSVFCLTRIQCFGPPQRRYLEM